MITVNMPEITPKITPSVIGSKYFSVVPEYATTPAKFESLVYPHRIAELFGSIGGYDLCGSKD
ncbi:MAG: hypothetical protein ACXWYD_14680 [Candidatus Binatia bacterium]